MKWEQAGALLNPTYPSLYFANDTFLSAVFLPALPPSLRGTVKVMFPWLPSCNMR